MVIRLLLGVVFLAAVSGCATTSAKTSQEQLQMRITDLEKKQEEKDSEIVDLQYQLKDLSSKLGTSKDSSDSPDAPVAYVDSAPDTSSAPSGDIIRVSASIKDIQTALKSAGNYSGKVDGKLGSGTKQAIIEFQKEHHLTADGILGKRTWKLLKTYLKE